MLPLDDVKVLDFSFHLPGPLAGLILAEAGAEVIKIERMDGDELRQVPPFQHGESLSFAMLNRGKKSIAVDLKSPDAVSRLTPLIEEADIVIEQFRPGVMDRLGLGYEALSRLNPSLIYCAITGYGQIGPDRLKAGHDLNYCADAGLLSLTADSTGMPNVPQVTIADIAGGSYPAVMNILLALRRRDRSGRGAYIDIAMTSNLFALQYWAIAECEATEKPPAASASFLTGGSPRYAIYRTADDRFLAAAPLEERFWQRFCDIIELPLDLRRQDASVQVTREAVAKIIHRRTAAEWTSLLGDDCCCNIVLNLQEAMSSEHFGAQQVFSKTVSLGGAQAPAVVVPISADLRSCKESVEAPALGTHDSLIRSGETP